MPACEYMFETWIANAPVFSKSATCAGAGLAGAAGADPDAKALLAMPEPALHRGPPDQARHRDARTGGRAKAQAHAVPLLRDDRSANEEPSCA